MAKSRAQIQKEYRDREREKREARRREVAYHSLLVSFARLRLSSRQKPRHPVHAAHDIRKAGVGRSAARFEDDISQTAQHDHPSRPTAES